MAIDFDGDGMKELIMTEYDSAFGGNPSGSGQVLLYYSTPSEIIIDEFSVKDLDGPDMDIACAGNVYHAYGHITNTWDLEDFNSIDLSFNFHGEAEGESVLFTWNRGLMEFVEDSCRDNREPCWLDRFAAVSALSILSIPVLYPVSFYSSRKSQIV
jgi:hypothetical protein